MLLAASLSSLVVGKADRSFAQVEDIPAFDETLAILDSRPRTILLYTHFSLAFSLALNIVSLEGDPRELPLLPSQRPETEDIFRALIAASREEQERERLLASISNADDPIHTIERQHSDLVSRFIEALAEAGLSGDSRLIANAVNSLTHVERIASVVVTDSDSSFLCRVFPFTYFCN
ncbi:hypothetical protein ACFFII_08130 [Paracoccus niistensis]|uniref:Uncharacterized protein n=1 Tax=Paracoccus niistensis TaxID=632935 RepID=A0ABV6I436_9RHOB